MQLFDTFERTDMGYKTAEESSYAHLNRSARPEFASERDLLERWFLNYPEAAQATFASNFTSDSYGPHLGAFFELYCYSLFRACGFDVHIEEVVDAAKGNPMDFVLGRVDEPNVCIESTVIADAELTVKSRHQLDLLHKRLNRIPSTRQLVLEVDASSKHPLPCTEIADEITRWLGSLAKGKDNDNSKDGGNATAPPADDPADDAGDSNVEHASSYAWERHGWELRFSVLPGLRVADLVPVQAEGGWTGESRLKRRLKKKADQHPGVQMPYIIAVDALSIPVIYRSERLIAEDLFGVEVFMINRDTGETEAVTRAPHLPGRPEHEQGFWWKQSGPRNQQVSAMLLVNEVVPWSVIKQTPVLWHNPWALHPVPVDVWPGPHMAFDAITGAYTRREGKTIAEIFASGWESGRHSGR